MKRWALIAVLGLLASCTQTASSGSPVVSEATSGSPHGAVATNKHPPLTGSTKMGGRGVPNGRSDSADPFKTPSGVSSDSSYGYQPQTAVRVGNPGAPGPIQSRLYLNALRGPSGQPIQYERAGSCCATPTDGPIDVYGVTYQGLEKPVVIYVDMYKPSAPLAPMGFTLRTAQ